MSKQSGLLTIGDLAEQSGVGAATLRAWEERHGFPVPIRLPSGHRRYEAGVVEVVREVVRRRDGGRRLDLAIAEATALTQSSAEPPTGSLYAELRRLHPALAGFRLRKSTLIALSWAIEDEFAARAVRPVLIGAFQRHEFYDASRRRWRALARVARDAIVLADFPHGSDPAATPREVALAPDSPMHREWSVVCDAVGLPAALAAWELPGQELVPDRDRLFEAVWTVEPQAVRDAARVCAGVAADHGDPGAPALLHLLAEDALPGLADLGSVTTLFNRIVAYVDAAH